MRFENKSIRFLLCYVLSLIILAFSFACYPPLAISIIETPHQVPYMDQGSEMFYHLRMGSTEMIGYEPDVFGGIGIGKSYNYKNYLFASVLPWMGFRGVPSLGIFESSFNLNISVATEFPKKSLVAFHAGAILFGGASLFYDGEYSMSAFGLFSFSNGVRVRLRNEALFRLSLIYTPCDMTLDEYCLGRDLSYIGIGSSYKFRVNNGLLKNRFVNVWATVGVIEPLFNNFWAVNAGISISYCCNQE